MSKFIYKCNVKKDKILKAIQKHECYDSWGEVQYGNDERAVEYNICIDNTATEETIYCSAFYGVFKNIRKDIGNMMMTRNGTNMKLILRTTIGRQS